MGGLAILCCGRRDENDDSQETPPRPAQQWPEKETQGVPAEVRKGDRSTTDRPVPRDLWSEAFDNLDSSRKKYLSAKGPTATDAIQKVIDDTTAKYEAWKKGGLRIHRKQGDDINIRDAAENIIAQAMKFREIVTKAVSFDPTKHASTAWMVISFGMSIVQNRLDRRDEIFGASDYLAETLAYYALVDENYRNQGVGSDKNLDDVLLRVYSAILNFTAQVKKDQEENEAWRIWHSILALTDQPLAELKSTVKAEGKTVQKWFNLAANLGDRKLAEAHLARTDESIEIAKNTESKIISAEEESQLEWISVAPYSTRQRALQDKRTHDTGVWFLNSKEYNDWKVTAGALLWLPGMTGCGKSVLCSTAIRDLEEICRLDQTKLIAYWYFEFGVDATQRVDAMSRSLIRQLSRSPLAPSVTDLWMEHRWRGSQPDSEAILTVLDDVLSRVSGQVYLVIDALDECPKTAYSEERESLLSLLLGLRKKHQNKIHILVTSRREGDISKHLNKFSMFDLEASLVEDVKKLVSASISQHLDKWSPEIKSLITDELLGSNERRFRWAELQIIELRKCRKEADIKKTLHEVPGSLEEFYRRALDSIDPKDIPLARNILMLLCLSPIALDLQTVADMVEINDPGDIVEICTTSLVRVFGDMIQIDHFSVQEFLIVSEKGSHHHECQFSVTAGHNRLAELTIDCLLAQTARLAKIDAMKRRWFLYASKYWHTHWVAAGGNDQAKINPLFTQPNVYANWTCAAGMQYELGTIDFDLEPWEKLFGSQFGPPIYRASVLGLSDTVDVLIAQGHNPFERNEHIIQSSLDSLTAAAQSGHLHIVQALLQKGFRLDSTKAEPILKRIDYRLSGQAKLAMILETLWHQGLLSEKFHDAGDTLSESAVKAAMANGHSSVQIMSIFLDWRPEVFLPSTEFLLECTLFSGSESLVRLLFDKCDAHIWPALIRDLLERQLSRVHSDILVFLAIELGDELPMTEALFLRVAGQGTLKSIQSLLQSRRKQDLRVTQGILEGAAKGVDSGCKLRLLWPCKEPGTEVSQIMLKNATANWRVGGDAVQFLSQRLPSTLILNEKAILKMISESKHGILTLKLFLDHPSLGLSVSDGLVTTICSHEQALGMLKLLPKDKVLGVPITGSMVCTAVWNRSDGPSVVRFLAELSPEPLLMSEKSIIESISRSQDGVVMLDMFLGHLFTGVSVSERLIKTICSHEQALGMLKLLPRDKVLSVPITESIVCTAAQNRTNGAAVVRYLAEISQGPLCIPERALIDAVENAKEEEDLSALIQNAPDAILTERVFLAACSNMVAMRVILDQKRKEPPIDKMLWRFFNESQGSSTVGMLDMKPMWGALRVLLERDLLDIDEHLVKSFTKNGKFFKVLLSLKPDTPITEEILLAVLEGREGTEAFGLMDIILNGPSPPPITKVVIRAACTGGQGFCLEPLLRRQPLSSLQEVWQEIWTDVDFDPEGKVFMLAVFLRLSSSELTDAILEEYPFDQANSCNYSLDEFILTFCVGCFPFRLVVTERVTEIIVERCDQETIQTFFDYYQITVTDKTLQAGQRNTIADKEGLIAMLEQKASI